MASLSFNVDLATYGPAGDFARAATLNEGRDYCRNLAERHYENFHVASLLLPRDCAPLSRRVRILSLVGRSGRRNPRPPAQPRSARLVGGRVANCYAGIVRHPVFVALRETISEFAIPIEPFADLLVAFRRDQQVHRYETADDVLDYCRYSANPVGRLVLYLGRAHDKRHGHCQTRYAPAYNSPISVRTSPEIGSAGGSICQQVECRRFNYSEVDFACHTYNDKFRRLLASEVQRADDCLRAGLPLVELMPGRLRGDVWLFAHGGLAILERIRQIDFDVGDGDRRFRELVSCDCWPEPCARNCSVAMRGSASRRSPESEGRMIVDLTASYAHCRNVGSARRATFIIRSSCCRVRSGRPCAASSTRSCAAPTIWGIAISRSIFAVKS